MSDKIKKCISCGRELPMEADFCPYCESSQLKKSIEAPPKARKWKYILPPVLIVAAVIIGYLLIRHVPKTYEGGEKVLYKADGKTWQLYAAFSNAAVLDGRGDPGFEVYEVEASDASIPVRLYVSSGEEVPQSAEQLEADAVRFRNLVESCTFETIPEEGYRQMPAGEAEVNEGMPSSLYCAIMEYSPDCGTNELVWTLHMKNKDTIIVRNHFTCHKQEQIRISYRDEPMETTEQLQAVMDRVTKEEDPMTLVELELAPVVYEGDIILKDRSFSFTGTTEGGKTTTLKGSMEVWTRDPQITELYNIRFEGDGGNGAYAAESLSLFNCTFTGYDVGLYGDDGSWIWCSDCLFEGNKTGMLFDSIHASSSRGEYYNNRFTDNETGICIKKIPGETTIVFQDFVFERNETDCDNALEDRIVFVTANETEEG